jgi:hypothetical protein
MLGSEISDIEPSGPATAASDNSLLVFASSFAISNPYKDGFLSYVISNCQGISYLYIELILGVKLHYKHCTDRWVS